MAAPLVRVGILPPPYRVDRVEPVPPGPIEFGSLLMCRLTPSWGSVEELDRRLTRIRLICAVPPVVAVMEGADGIAEAGMIRRLWSLRVRAVVASDALSVGALRLQLAAPADIAGELADWVPSISEALSWSTIGMLRPFLSSATVEPEPGSAAPDGKLLRAARDRLRRDGLPPPNKWIRLVRCLQAALAAQRNPDGVLARVAVEHGFCDQSAMCRAFHDLFALTPSEARKLLGWEWLAARFLGLHGRHGGQQTHRRPDDQGTQEPVDGAPPQMAPPPRSGQQRLFPCRHGPAAEHLRYAPWPPSPRRSLSRPRRGPWR
jgi:hypothetical protein